MTNFQVIFAPEASIQLIELENHIIEASGLPDVAARYVNGLVDFCEKLNTFPERGSRRDDLLPGLRVMGYHKRTNVAVIVDAPNQTVHVVGIFHGGQDYETTLGDE